MRWLQSTFAKRFKGFHKERGHVFQGSYKAILINENRPLLGLIDYIHLNPVRAKLYTVDELRGYARSSFSKYLKRTVHPPLDRVTLLQLGDLPTTLAGMHKYTERLKLLDERDPKKRVALEKNIARAGFSAAKKRRRNWPKIWRNRIRQSIGKASI